MVGNRTIDFISERLLKMKLLSLAQRFSDTPMKTISNVFIARKKIEDKKIVHTIGDDSPVHTG